MTFKDRVSHFEQRIAPVWDEHGEVSAVLFSLHDLTSLINAERARDATELRFETLFQNTQDEVLVYELSDEMLPGRILEANDTACRRSEERRVGKECRARGAPDEVKEEGERRSEERRA